MDTNDAAKKLNTKSTAKDVWDKDEEASKKVDEMADKVDDFADSIFPEKSRTDATVTVERNENISRLFIFRFLWFIPQ